MNIDNFDLKKFLVENKLTRNSKLLESHVDKDGNLVTGLDDWEKHELVSSLPRYTEEYLVNKGMEEYIEGNEGDAGYALEELGIDTRKPYLKVLVDSERDVFELYFDLGDGYVLSTDDYDWSIPVIYKKGDLDRLLDEYPELRYDETSGEVD